MQVIVMKTDGGPHSPEKEAVTTAGQIIQIAADASGSEAVEGRKLELLLIDVLEKHHGDVKASERGKIAEHGHERLSHPLDPTEHVDVAFNSIMEAVNKNLRYDHPFAVHFASPEVQLYVRNVLGQHFATSMWNERSWHADGSVIGDDHKPSPNPTHDPDNEHVRAFKAARVRGN